MCRGAPHPNPLRERREGKEPRSGRMRSQRAWLGLLLARGGVGAGLGDLPILRRRPAGNSNSANDLAVDKDGDPAFERGCSTKAKDAHVDTALRYQVFEHLARSAKIERGMRLVLGYGDRAILRVVELVQHHRVTAAVENDYGHWPVVLGSFGFSGGHHLLGRVETDWRAVRRRRGRRGCGGLLGTGRNGPAGEDHRRDDERREFLHSVFLMAVRRQGTGTLAPCLIVP